MRTTSVARWIAGVACLALCGGAAHAAVDLRVPAPTLLKGKNVSAVAGSGKLILASTNVGMFRSTNGGTTFRPAGLAGDVTTVVGTGLTFYAGVGDVVSRSTDGGASWTALTPLARPDVTARPVITAIAVAGTTMLVGTDRGVFVSTDAGASWVARQTSGFGLSDQIDAVGIQPGTGHLWVGGHNTGAFRSTDGGANWFAYNEGLPGQGSGGGSERHNVNLVWFQNQGGNPSVVVGSCSILYGLNNDQLGTYAWSQLGSPQLGSVVSCSPGRPTPHTKGRYFMTNYAAVGLCGGTSGCFLVARMKTGRANGAVAAAPTKKGLPPRLIVATPTGVSVLATTFIK